MSGSPAPLSLQKQIVDVLNKNKCLAPFALITRYHNQDYTTNLPYYKFVKQLYKKGHEIAAHICYHNNLNMYSSNDLTVGIKQMRQNFTDMDIPARTFIFPWLQPCWKTIQECVKK